MLFDGRDAVAVEHAAAVLAGGGLVGFPTETVYGLGARADDNVAVAKIFAAKGRPADHPLIVHVQGVAQAAVFASELPAVAQRLTSALWPGPLTVIVPRASRMAEAAAGGQASIGLRCPSHPVAHALLAAAARLGVPGVAAPSANRFGRVSPTRAAHVVAEFGDDLLVLDGGDSEVGIESAIVDCSRGQPVLLRPGVLTRGQIESVAGQRLLARDAAAPRAPGSLETHYAPRARLQLLAAPALRAALQSLDSASGRVAVYSHTVHAELRPSATWPRLYKVMPMQADLTARELFSVLHEFDDDGVQLILVEEPPDTPAWEGVRDRLRRAATA
ncbi:MAG: L-threonylcarbamoyladenylate synthase [Burkholderiaceae bacterium]|nr:L-threonylcarbamoyladenylate synthase [Burkholderiaceae bacterium]